MTYESEISFTLDTICPWTYLAKRRLRKALLQLPSSSPVKFTLVFRPYELYPSLPTASQSKESWYATSRYGDTAEKWATYQKVMKAYGEAEGIAFQFGGEISNTFPAHRAIQHFQRTKGPETAEKLVDAFYRMYFEEEQPPASRETLLRGLTEAGISEDEAAAFVDDAEIEEMETKEAIQEQKGNQVDAVPFVVIAGKRRDHSLEGAKEVKEYVTVLERVIKESQ